MKIDFKKLLNVQNVFKIVSLVNALKGLRGKSPAETVEGGIEVVENALGIDVADEKRITQLMRDTEAWAKEGERIAREGETLLQQVREAVAHIGR